MVTFVFPGQGSQSPGMGKALCEAFPAARAVFEAADDALGMNLSKLCFEGPEETLKQTEITQPAILTTSIAVLKAIRSARPDLQPSYAAGHSLGEFSALVAANVMRFEDAVKLVRTRGRLMQRAVPEGQGAMAAVLGLDADIVAKTCAEVAEDGSIVSPANFNGPGQTVISGATSAVEEASSRLSEAGATKVVRLPVSAPFHCALMQSAADGLADALKPIEINRFDFPVVTNVDAQPNTEPDRVKDLLVRQVTAPVRWVETVTYLAEAGETIALEVGPAKILAGLGRRIDKRLKVMPTQDPD
ncbi:MAG: ACP S-malonyltransferase, partial [Myxococcota bacterium]